MAPSKQQPEVGDVWPMKPPPSDASGDWPQPTERVYPLKQSDTLLANGLLYSGGLGRVKAEQHDDKIVVEWTGDDWVVRRVPPRSTETTDTVAGQAATAWRRAARRHQHQWRVDAGWPAGRQRTASTDQVPWRPIGSRVELTYAKETGCNFLNPAIVAAVEDRLSHKQPHETLDEERLWCDLLSSMPMCFNLFGPLHQDASLAQEAVQRWFPDMALPNATVTVHFEWSPGRRDPQWLGDRTAFDAMIEITDGERHHLIGIETKYHEYPAATAHKSGPPARYLEVNAAAGLLSEATVRSRIWGTPLEQVWRDHLLALACGQDPAGWNRVHYILAAPQQNPAWRPLVDEYRSLLEPGTEHSVEYRPLEALLDRTDGLLPHGDTFRARYLDIMQ